MDQSEKLRLLNQDDAKLYKEIRLEALKNHPEAFSSSYEEEKDYSIEVFEKRLSIDNIYTFGAFEKEKLIGVVTLIVEQKNKLKHRANIVAMYVKPANRKIGIGKELMVEAINNAKNIECISQIYLTVTSSNEAAKGLYISLGFHSYGIDKNALKVGNTFFDDELMVLAL